MISRDFTDLLLAGPVVTVAPGSLRSVISTHREMATSSSKYQLELMLFCAFLLGIPPALKRWRDSVGLTSQKVRTAGTTRRGCVGERVVVRGMGWSQFETRFVAGDVRFHPTFALKCQPCHADPSPNAPRYDANRIGLH